MRSIVDDRIKFVVWSCPSSWPVRVRPSEVIMVTVSVRYQRKPMLERREGGRTADEGTER
jgi:hypothetical protein